MFTFSFEAEKIKLNPKTKKNVSRIKREIMLSYQKLKKVIMNPKTVKIMAVKKKNRTQKYSTPFNSNIWEESLWLTTK